MPTYLNNWASTLPQFPSAPFLTTDGSGKIQSGTTLGITYGGTGVTSVTTTPTATSFAGWDVSKNLSANAFVPGFSPLTLIGTTATLTVASPQYIHTGGTGGTIVLPNATTLTPAQYYWIDNDCSGNVVVETNGAATLATIPSGGFLTVYLASNGTAPGSWYYYFAVPDPAIGSTGQVFTSNGPGVAPTFQAAASGGITTIDGDSSFVTGSTVTLTGGTSGAVFTGNGTTTMTESFNYLSLPITTSVNGQILINSVPFLHGYGAVASSGNIFLGPSAGNFTTTTATGTIENIGIGKRALLNLTGGRQNVCVGGSAGTNITSGEENTLIGQLSGAALTTGFHNCYVGFSNGGTSANANTCTIVGDDCGTAWTGGETNNIIIGSSVTGVAGDANICRIGNAFQTNAYISGTVRGSNGFVATAGNISAPAGTVSANTTVTAGTNLVSTAGNLLLPTTSSTAGQIQINAARFFHAYGTDNAFIGLTSGNFTLSGTQNVGIGTNALNALTSGSNNMAIGYGALALLTSGANHVAIGRSALSAMTTNNNCCAIGYNALFKTTGASNIGIGVQAGASFSSGTDNVMIGTNCGINGLNYTITGTNNVAIGSSAFGINTLSGAPSNNACVGYGTLGAITSASYNTAIGSLAGSGYTSTEASNICIGYNTVGTAAESNVLRIGTATGTGNGQLNKAYISGIQTITVTGTPVLVSSSDQLGVAASSKRFKENIQDMGNFSSPMMKLRPVTFTYKTGDDKSVQPGLIAEEVEQIMPEMVTFDKDGQPFTVKYHVMAAMLLNEIQKLYKRIEVLEAKLAAK